MSDDESFQASNVIVSAVQAIAAGWTRPGVLYRSRVSLDSGRYPSCTARI
jgi:hypothetical protein